MNDLYKSCLDGKAAMPWNCVQNWSNGMIYSQYAHATLQSFQMFHLNPPSHTKISKRQNASALSQAALRSIIRTPP